VLYYISPQVWAWRKGRVKTIAKLVETILVVFPFEVELYVPLVLTFDSSAIRSPTWWIRHTPVTRHADSWDLSWTDAR